MIKEGKLFFDIHDLINIQYTVFGSMRRWRTAWSQEWLCVIENTSGFDECWLHQDDVKKPAVWKHSLASLSTVLRETIEVFLIYDYREPL